MLSAGIPHGERLCWHSVDMLADCDLDSNPLGPCPADCLLGGGGLATDSTLSRGQTAPVILIARLFLYVSLPPLLLPSSPAPGAPLFASILCLLVALPK